MDEFICDKCGLCCQNLKNNVLAKDFDDGNGVCIYLDKNTKLCSIYENRPLICDVKKGYTMFENLMSYEEYLVLNYKACEEIKRRCT